MSEERCETCRLWDRHPVRPGLGQCKRSSPVLAPRLLESLEPGALYAATRFPVTDAAEWCGEYQADFTPQELSEEDAKLSAEYQETLQQQRDQFSPTTLEGVARTMLESLTQKTGDTAPAPNNPPADSDNTA